MSSENSKNQLTSLQNLIVNEPNQRFILWIIANDSKAFSSHFNVELLKRPDLLIPDKAPNLSKAMVIYQNLLKKKMIDVSNPLKTKITWKGNFYRFYTHPSLPFWGIVIGAIVGLSIFKFDCSGKENNKGSETKQQIQQPTADSPLYHQKKDTFLSKKDTTQQEITSINNQKIDTMPSGTTGQICQVSGDYKCSKHSSQIIPIAKGNVFPPCNTTGRPAHGATWMLIKKR